MWPFPILHHPPGLTVPLLTTSSGEKLGKSAGNAVWLSGSSYSLYQSLLQTADQQVAASLHRLTFISAEEVEALMEQHSVGMMRGSPCNHSVLSAVVSREVPGPDKTGRGGD